MAMFTIGSGHVNSVPVTVSLSGQTCQLVLFLTSDPAGKNVAANFISAAFNSTGALQNIPISVPTASIPTGIYYAFIAVYVNNTLVLVQPQSEMVILTSGSVPSPMPILINLGIQYDPTDAFNMSNPAVLGSGVQVPYNDRIVITAYWQEFVSVVPSVLLQISMIYQDGTTIPALENQSGFNSGTSQGKPVVNGYENWTDVTGNGIPLNQHGTYYVTVLLSYGGVVVSGMVGSIIVP